MVDKRWIWGILGILALVGLLFVLPPQFTWILFLLCPLSHLFMNHKGGHS